MRKIVSTKEGYTFFIDEGDCVDYETGKHLTGVDVANKLKITPVAVSQTLKRSLRKIYYHVKRTNRYLNPVDIMILLAEICGCETDDEYRSFYKLFPPKIKGEVLNAAIQKI